MNGGFDGAPQFCRHAGLSAEPAMEGAFEIADAFLHGAVVAWTGRRIVQREHGVTCQQLIDVLVVERGAVIPFEEQRRTVSLKEFFEVVGDLPAIEPMTDQRFKTVTGSQVLHGDDLPVAIFGGVK